MKYFLFSVLCLLFSACGRWGALRTEEEKPTIVVAIEPLRYFAEALAGQEFQVVSLVPQGGNPESYDPTPGQLIDLASGKAYLGIPTIGFEAAWRSRLTQNAPHVPFFDVTKGIDLIHSADDYEESDHHHHHATDPHVWTSPWEALVVVENMAEALATIDTLHRADYRHRADSLGRKLLQLDSLFASRLQPDMAFLSYHPTFSYLARRYGLHQLCIEEEGREPSPAHLAQIIEEGRRRGVRVVLVQPEFDVRHAAIIADELNARVVEVNPLSYEWDSQLLKVLEEMSAL